MPELSFDRWCDLIEEQTALLTDATADADLATPVPSCPGWNLWQLLRHLGGGQRWAASIVRNGATEPPPDTPFRVLSPVVGDRAALTAWLTEGAAELAGELRTAGPDAPIWTPVPAVGAAFYARRFAHETAVHRADAVLALGGSYALEPDHAIDALDEWLELGSLPLVFDVHPERRALLGPGRTIHLHATDVPAEAHAEWVVDLTGEVLAWRRAHEKSAVAVRGPLTALLLVVYGRQAARDAPVEVLGDRALLEEWLGLLAFG
ncbi:MAG: maleylpyruvate isomerase family mycothiol-dependent enzyme [Frankiales bacterium]|nr:maleylpyruvate isomerase family mycothiol-dependent enzyme [Frankiales bacterium]